MKIGRMSGVICKLGQPEHVGLLFLLMTLR
jgi:hypothetical protein